MRDAVRVFLTRHLYWLGKMVGDHQRAKRDDHIVQHYKKAVEQCYKKTGCKSCKQVIEGVIYE